ncbi:MAG TPA: hypothetical protein VHZ52_12355 [Acidobacteriaceae bacterium]|jgi:hypothetical protein|nr:hypothetical protein [Acidobacteriaceae bacterium]
MTLLTCQHEAEIRRLLQLGHWPQSCTADLRTHAETCRACGDLVLLTQAFQGARAVSIRNSEERQAELGSSLPAPGVLWWRAQLRRRNAAVKQIQRPILGAQIFAFALTLLVAAGLLVSQARHGVQWLAWLESLPQAQAFHWEVLWSSASALKTSASLGYLVPGAVLLALVSGVVAYLATEKQ